MRKREGQGLWLLVLCAAGMIGFLYFFATLPAGDSGVNEGFFGNLHQKTRIK